MTVKNSPKPPLSCLAVDYVMEGIASAGVLCSLNRFGPACALAALASLTLSGLFPPLIMSFQLDSSAALIILYV